MNHRQWKKKFKKVHGRNPYYLEDKRNREKLIYRVNTLPEIFSGFSLLKAASALAEALSTAFSGLAEAFARASEGFTQISTDLLEENKDEN